MAQTEKFNLNYALNLLNEKEIYLYDFTELTYKENVYEMNFKNIILKGISKKEDLEEIIPELLQKNENILILRNLQILIMKS